MSATDPATLIIPTHNDPCVNYEETSDRTIDSRNGFRLAVRKNGHSGNPFSFELIDDHGAPIVSGQFELSHSGSPGAFETNVEILMARRGVGLSPNLYPTDYDLTYLASLLRAWIGRFGADTESLTIVDNRELYRDRGSFWLASSVRQLRRKY